MTQNNVMSTNRLEAFSDGVMAIIITIMVLELKVPHGEGLEAILPLWPVFLSYLLSFLYVGIYWNNHHHMMTTTTHVNGGVLWANLHLLFWLSLIPFVTGWMGENHFAALPCAVYGFVLTMCAVAYAILQYSIIYNDGKGSPLARAIGKDLKGKLSPALYITAMVIAFYSNMASLAIYIGVALMWLIPDSRIEKEVIRKELQKKKIVKKKAR